MIKLMIGIVILACSGLFFIKGPDGQPLLTIDALFSASKPTQAEAGRSTAPTKIYKWQDEHGVWQFSNTPVPSAEAELVILDGQINTIDAYVAPAKPNQPAVANSRSALPAGVTTVSPDKIVEMMEKVNNLQQTVDDRKAEIDRKTSAQ
mgnify:CR=1 FL=1